MTKLADGPRTIYIQWSGDEQFIRKWSFKPFDLSEPFNAETLPVSDIRQPDAVPGYNGWRVDSAVELMGEALSALSDRLRQADFIHSDSNPLTDVNFNAYQRVGKAWDKLTAAIAKALPLSTWDHYAEEHVTPDAVPGDLVALTVERDALRGHVKDANAAAYAALARVAELKAGVGNIKKLATKRLFEGGPDGNLAAIEGFARALLEGSKP